MDEQKTTMRLGKYLAHLGLSSRRSVPELLKQKTVTVNGKKTKDLSFQVDPQKDTIAVNGVAIKKPTLLYYMVNKPKGVISTASDEKGRKTVISLIPSKDKLYPVGRLDQNTTGLLLLTNDGELANRLTHPKFHVSKTYRLRIRGVVPPDKLGRFRKGVRLYDGITQPAEVTIISESPNETILEVILHEGRKRQIRRMCEALKLQLLDLKRIAVGQLQLGNLAEGKYQALSPDELELLK